MHGSALVALGGGRVEYRDVQTDEPRETDIVVEVEFSAISAGTEGQVISVDATIDRPLIPGYGPVGRVVWAGADTDFAAGDRVTYFAGRGPLEPYVPWGGGHLSPAVVDADRGRTLLGPNDYCLRVPDEVPGEHAAFAGISAVSHLAARLPRPDVGEKVVVVGQGLIGLFATRHLALLGASVLALDRKDARLDLARRMGADHVARPGDTVAAAIRSVWPDGADVLVDTTSKERTVEDALDGVRREGSVVFAGWYQGDDFALGRLQGRVFRSYFPFTLVGGLVEASLRLMAMGALPVEPLISHRFPARDAAAAFELVLRRPAAYTGILLDWRT